jgi:hypothetical protein
MKRPAVFFRNPHSRPDKLDETTPSSWAARVSESSIRRGRQRRLTWGTLKYRASTWPVSKSSSSVRSSVGWQLLKPFALCLTRLQGHQAPAVGDDVVQIVCTMTGPVENVRSNSNGDLASTNKVYNSCTSKKHMHRCQELVKVTGM